MNDIAERAVLADGTDVDVVVSRMDNDSELRDHWQVVIARHPARSHPPIKESYPLPPEAGDAEIESVANELLDELNQQKRRNRNEKTSGARRHRAPRA